MLYASVGFLALIILLIVNYDMFRRGAGKKDLPAHRAYRAFLTAVSAYYISDSLWGILYEKQLITLTYLDTAACFVSMAFSVLLWTRFVIVYLKEIPGAARIQKDASARILTVFSRIVFAAGIVAVVINFLRPVMFFFDAQGVYRTAFARYITLAGQIVIFILTGIYALYLSHNTEGKTRRRQAAIGTYSIAMAVFSGLQVFFPFFPVYGIGWLIGCCVLHSFVLEVEEEEYRDELEEKLEESIRRGNYYDLLTGLSGMSHFLSYVEKEREEMAGSGKEAAFLFLNLSGMKFYNKNYGFAKGDLLLRSFSQLLGEVFGSENCSRFGQDHFAVLTQEYGLEEKIRDLFRKWENEKTDDRLSIRLGVYLDRMERIDISSAYDRAKAASDAIPGGDHSAFQYYDVSMLQNAEKRHYILSHLDQAISEKWIQIYYQPIVRAVSGSVCDEEALARWNDPVKGLLSPAEFIPALEEAKLIYKLDLYVLENVLQKLDQMEKAGFYPVPQSINLSRSDFDACDIVEEIRKRVDAAGIDHDKITIEITESVVGRDLAFISSQIERFQSLKFPVWMDDFGSGYSSLTVLQNIKFDLIKFDMSFMRRLEEGVNGKIILTELMKMATSLGVDTVCEGVETEEQVRFLQEIGCSKLQGYYFCKPIPFEEILNRYEQGRQIGFENPAESEYFEAVGRVNLYDLAVVASEDERTFQNFFNTIPMGIMEISKGQIRFARSNQTYRDFMLRFFHYDVSREGQVFTDYSAETAPAFMRIVVQCCENGGRTFFDEQMPDGSVVHSFVRCVAANPVTGVSAVAIAVLSISDPDDGASYAEIARALAADYHFIYIVDLDTDRYIEYSSEVGEEELVMEQRGEDFFAESRKGAHRIFEEDRDVFYSAFSKENIIRSLEEQGSFTAIYRLMDTGVPVYMSMKASRMQSNRNRIIIGVNNIDAQMKQKAHYEELQKEREAMTRVMALSDGYLSLFTVDVETGHYIEYSSSDDFESLGSAKEGEDFFRDAAIDAEKYFYQDDIPVFLAHFTEENVMNTIHMYGSFQIRYRLMINGKPKPVILKVAPFKDGDREKLVVGIREFRKRKRIQKEN